MFASGLLGMLFGIGLAALSTHLKQESARVEFSAGVCFVAGCLLAGAALQPIF